MYKEVDNTMYKCTHTDTCTKYKEKWIWTGGTCFPKPKAYALCPMPTLPVTHLCHTGGTFCSKPLEGMSHKECVLLPFGLC